MKKYLTGKSLTGMWKGNTAASKDAQKAKEINPLSSLQFKKSEEPKHEQIAQESK